MKNPINAFMKYFITSLIFLFATLGAIAAILPDSFTWTWSRNATSSYGDTNIWYTGTTYALLSNAVMTATSGVAIAQDLTDCGVELRVGDATTNRVFACTVAGDATGGIINCASFIIPTSTPRSHQTMQTSLQLSITSGTTRVTLRGQFWLYCINPLQ